MRCLWRERQFYTEAFFSPSVIIKTVEELQKPAPVKDESNNVILCSICFLVEVVPWWHFFALWWWQQELLDVRQGFQEKLKANGEEIRLLKEEKMAAETWDVQLFVGTLALPLISLLFSIVVFSENALRFPSKWKPCSRMLKNWKYQQSRQLKIEMETTLERWQLWRKKSANWKRI